MHRLPRLTCAMLASPMLAGLTFASLAGGDAASAENFWPDAAARETIAMEAISPLLAARSPSPNPVLLRHLTASAAHRSNFASAAENAAATTALATVPETTEIVAGAVQPATAAPAPPVVVAGTSVRDQMAFEAALATRLAAGAPTPTLRPLWSEIAELYGANFQRAFWRTADGWSPAARATVARLAHARDDALTLPPIAPTVLLEGSPETIAAQDVALTAAAVVYARQAAGDRVNPARVAKLITARPTLPAPHEIIAAVAGAGDHASDVLAAFNPPHAGYRALREKLAELRQAAGPTATRIPPGMPLRIGMRDPRVPMIRARFGLEIVPQAANDVLYDVQVAGAVAGFQRENGLSPTGVLTPRTVALLSGGEPRRLENEIIANMERWRWLPRDLGADRIEVDIPNFALTLVRDGKVVHRARVIVGKPQSPTPVFSNMMKSIIVNPSWYIPPSILKNEILPKLASDPGYLARLGYEMTVSHGQVSVRQPPGERNALGRIKFMFPNEHSVYLHDTPSRGLFASPRRALSHGCVRVDDPFALAAAVLGGTWTQSRMKSLVGGSERTINLPTALPIHIEYFTAAVGADGRLQFRDDIYGYDREIVRALALPE